jgi:hypothetical protein
MKHAAQTSGWLAQAVKKDPAGHETYSIVRIPQGEAAVPFLEKQGLQFGGALEDFNLRLRERADGELEFYLTRHSRFFLDVVLRKHPQYRPLLQIAYKEDGRTPTHDTFAGIPIVMNEKDS